jgi:hypothetical protein
MTNLMAAGERVMSTIQSTTFHRPIGPPSSAVLAVKAAVSTIVQRRNGAREPARVLYYRAHSLLRTIRHHLQGIA